MSAPRVALATALALAPASAAAQSVTDATLDAVTVAGAPGRWTATASGGFPWITLRGQYAPAGRLAVVAEVQTALLRRWTPSAGLALRVVDASHFRMGVELLAGWLVQTGATARRGPTVDLRVRLAFPVGRVVPFVTLASRHTALFDRTETQRASGTSTGWSARHEWTPWPGLGVAVAITRRVGVELGVEWPFVDAPDTVSIPGAHLALHLGGGP